MSGRWHVGTLRGLEDHLSNAAFALCAGDVVQTDEMALQVAGLRTLAPAGRRAACSGTEALLRRIRTRLLWAAGRETRRRPVRRVTTELIRVVEELLARESVERRCALPAL